MKIEIGKSYATEEGQVAHIMGTTKERDEWFWSLQGNWYEASTGKFIYCQRDGTRITHEGNHRNLVGEVSNKDHPHSTR